MNNVTILKHKQEVGLDHQNQKLVTGDEKEQALQLK